MDFARQIIYGILAPARYAESKRWNQFPLSPGERAGVRASVVPEPFNNPSRIPTGFRPKAQGCEVRATLGIQPQTTFNRNAVAASLCSRSKREQPGRSAESKRWNPFPLSPGERAGVRASVNPFSSLPLQPN